MYEVVDMTVNSRKDMAGIPAVNWRRVCCQEGWKTYGGTPQEQVEEKDSVIH